MYQFIHVSAGFLEYGLCYHPHFTKMHFILHSCEALGLKPCFATGETHLLCGLGTPNEFCCG